MAIALNYGRMGTYKCMSDCVLYIIIQYYRGECIARYNNNNLQRPKKMR